MYQIVCTVDNQRIQLSSLHVITHSTCNNVYHQLQLDEVSDTEINVREFIVIIPEILSIVFIPTAMSARSVYVFFRSLDLSSLGRDQHLVG